ncbi:MAG: glycosyltransferase, partial [Bacteroidales bacterium]|jgi:GT2 family glycosyltransferase|nr:glycosyltransferase [Bacteroidales bacterium]
LHGNAALIEDTEYANIYQFVFKCLKKKYYFENKETCKIIKLYKSNSSSLCKVYLNTGDGFNPDEVLSIPLNKRGNRFFVSADITSDVKSIRFDPDEGSPCIINDMKIITDNGVTDYRNTNGIEANGIIVFNTIDPQITIDFDGIPFSRIKISGEIYKFTFDDIVALSKMKDFIRDYCELEMSLLKTNEKIQNITSSYQAQCQALITERDVLQSQRQALITERDVLQSQLNVVENMYKTIVNSEFWKITKPFRVLLNTVKHILKHLPLVKYIYMFLASVNNFGHKETIRKTKSIFMRKKYSFKIVNRLSKSEIKIQKEAQFPRNIKFSVLVPLLNTPQKYLKEMIKSVKEQTYENWEMCLADGSDKDHVYIRNICEKHAKKDHRILYKKLDKNLGISTNTNECIYMSSGEYIALLDPIDLLHPSVLYEVIKTICNENADIIYTDEDKVDKNTKTLSEPYFKPDFAIDNLRACNYICHLTVFKKSLLDEIGLFDSKFDGSEDHDMILRLVEKSEMIVHIPKILYHRRIKNNPADYNISHSGILAVSNHLKRCGLDANVTMPCVSRAIYRIGYKIIGDPLISIIIPNKDHVEDIEKCVSSIIDKSTYSNYEIIVVENGSETKEIFNYYNRIKCSNVKVACWDGGFNYPEINNFGRKSAGGDYIVLMNNDVEIISPCWIEEMLMFCQRQDVGIVGAKLYYPDNTIQHGGVILGILDGVAGHSHKFFPRNHAGYMGRLIYQQDLSAVTAACMMVKASVFDEVGGLDPAFAVAYNDVDFCMRVRKTGYLIVWTPYAEAYHHESKSRGLDTTPEKFMRYEKEKLLFQERWANELEAGDKYYNVNLTLARQDFSVK